MTEIDEIRSALAALDPGTRVRLNLEDGMEVVGVFRDVDDTVLRLEDAPRTVIEIDRIRRLVIELSTPDPE